MALSYNEILAKKLARLDSVPTNFVNVTDSVQNEVYKETLKLINQMDTAGGNFVYNEKNLNIISQLDKTLTKSVYNDEFIGGLTGFIKEFETQALYSNDLFSYTFDDFEPTDLYNTTLRSTQENALDLYSEQSFTQQISKPLKDTLNSAVTQEMSFADIQATVQTFVLGNEQVDGSLISYVKNTAYDAFAVADRTYYQAVANDYQVEWYNYVGGEIKTTRCFCEARNGHAFHIENIRDWGRGKDLGDCRSGNLWQGATKGTNESTIFNFVGGYRCQHSLVATSLSRVNKQDLENAIRKGYYKPKK